MIHKNGLSILLSLSLLCELCVAKTPAENYPINLTPSPGWHHARNDSDPAAESRKPSNPSASNSGLEFLLVDRQINVATQESTSHIMYRIASEAGLSEGAQISREFDPDYEACEYHFVRLWRQGQVQDRLADDEFKVLQQERDLDRQLYNGKLSAVLLLKDVRIGDIIEYSFTLRGENPVFAGKFIATELLGWGSPVKQQHLRVIVPPGRHVNKRTQGLTPASFSTVTRENGETELLWSAYDLKPINFESDAPGWYVQYPYVELSEFIDWPEVVRWALPLYDHKSGLSDNLKQKTRQLISGRKNTAEQALSILDFVQREVRYLGFELGPSSHRPHPPAEVFAHRYGDCKDKASLLCAMLSEAGILAHPVLVNTYQTRTIDYRLPSPYAFNHVIVRAVIDGTDCWLDPTQTYQRGGLASRGFRASSLGLVVSNEAAAQSDLSPIPASSAARASMHLQEDYEISDYKAPARLHLRYFYQGEMANNIRYYLANNSPEKITRDFLDYHKRSTPELSLATPLRWTDSEDHNDIRLEFDCLVPDLWRQDEKGAVAQAEFYPWPLHGYAVQPEALTRHSPLGLNYPVQIEAVFNIHLPDNWSLRDSEREIGSAHFKFLSHVVYRDRQLQLHYQWESLADSVSRDQLQEHVAKLAEVRRHLGYTLTRSLKLEQQLREHAPNWLSIMLVASALVGWSVFGFWLYHRPSSANPPLLNDKHLQGLSGWLILPAFGLVLRPFMLITSIYSNRAAYFDHNVWLNYMSAESSLYQPGIGWLLLFEAFGNTSLLVLNVIAAVLFFRMKRFLPSVMIGILAVTPLFLALDHVWGSTLTIPDRSGLDASLQEAIRGGIAAAVWIPYFLYSRRVKATFTR